jgi:ATP-binding cassette subfamily F protein uup
MLSQRGTSKLDDRKLRARTSGDDDKPAARSQESAKAASKKLSFKQKFALENLPKKIEAATDTINRLEDQIADPGFYDRDPTGFQKTIAALDKERAALAAFEEEWLELEMLREELEG